MTESFKVVVIIVVKASSHRWIDYFLSNIIADSVVAVDIQMAIDRVSRVLKLLCVNSFKHFRDHLVRRILRVVVLIRRFISAKSII